MRGVPCIFNYPSLTLTPGLTTAPDNDYRDIQFLAAGDLLVAMNAAPDSGGIPNIKRGIEVYRANEPGYPPFGRKFRIHDRDMLWSQTANSSNFELLALPNDSVNWVVYIQSRGPSVPSLNVKSVAVLHIDSQAPVSGSIRKKGDVTGVQNVYDIEFVLGL